MRRVTLRPSDVVARAHSSLPVRASVASLGLGSSRVDAVSARWASAPAIGTRLIVLAEKCVDGITANRERLRESVENSIGLVTALNPYIGYQAATDIAREALLTGAGVAELVVAHGLMDAEQLAASLRPEVLAHLQHAETTPSAPEATNDDPETE